MSEVEGLPSAEPVNVVVHVVGLAGRLVKAPDLFHDHPGLGEVTVGDIDRETPLAVYLVEFFGQRVGPKVQAALCQRLFTVLNAVSMISIAMSSWSMRRQNAGLRSV